MNGIHDMGGMHGLGPVEPEANEPVFHSGWERRVLALHLAAGALGRWNIDMGRYTREQMPPAEYLNATYYERWLWGLERLAVQRGLIAQEELDATRRGVSTAKPGPVAGSAVKPLSIEQVAPALSKGSTARVHEKVVPRFKAGERVLARNLNPVGHTRLPRFARGRYGVIDRDHGVFVFPDTNAVDYGKKPQHCYSVRFTAQELWGAQASTRDAVYVDLWDDYLDPA